MARATSRFICQECGAVFPKWMGQCEICKSWNSITEELISIEEGSKNIAVPSNFFSSIHSSKDIDETLFYKRHKTSLEEFNRVLGGGFVDGSVILLGGQPGIGKSTLLIQLLDCISEIENYAYVSAEESISQVILRAKRVGINNNKIKIASAANVTQIISAISKIHNNSIIIIDSIQTIYSELIQSPPGSISQVRFCTQELINFAKKNNAIIVIVGHITKDGAIAGPKTLEHMVDCVLYFEGEGTHDYRILRGSKNRFGPTDEICIFSMTERGLVEVSNPSSAFLSEHNDDVSGVAVFSGIEGSRPILSEVQALVANTSIPMPRRASIGFDSNRLSMLVAVLSKRCRLNFANKDVYLNIAGGLKISEPAIDLAVVSAILSSLFQKPLPNNSVFFGEVSLSGDIRNSHLAFSRIKEAQKLGFTVVYCSHKTDNFEQNTSINIKKIKSVIDICQVLR
jgi:DNA repair protein RadA/Sms